MAGILFTEGKIGALIAKNRLVRSAVNDPMGNLDGTLSEGQFSLYEGLAKFGAGTIITGHKFKNCVFPPRVCRFGG